MASLNQSKLIALKPTPQQTTRIHSKSKAIYINEYMVHYGTYEYNDATLRLLLVVVLRVGLLAKYDRTVYPTSRQNIQFVYTIFHKQIAACCNTCGYNACVLLCIPAGLLLGWVSHRDMNFLPHVCIWVGYTLGI